MLAAVRKASAATGIPEAHIRLAATHTHSGPFLTAEKGPVGYDLTQYRESFDRYWEVTADKIAGAIIEANARLAPAHIGGAKGVGHDQYQSAHAARQRRAGQRGTQSRGTGGPRPDCRSHR